jgi:hypothetical protein
MAVMAPLALSVASAALVSEQEPIARADRKGGLGHKTIAALAARADKLPIASHLR